MVQLRIVSKVLVLSEAVRIATNLVIIVMMHLVIVLLINKELVDAIRAILIWIRE